MAHWDIRMLRSTVQHPVSGVLLPVLLVRVDRHLAGVAEQRREMLWGSGACLCILSAGPRPVQCDACHVESTQLFAVCRLPAVVSHPLRHAETHPHSPSRPRAPGVVLQRRTPHVLLRVLRFDTGIRAGDATHCLGARVDA